MKMIAAAAAAAAAGRYASYTDYLSSLCTNVSMQNLPTVVLVSSSTRLLPPLPTAFLAAVTDLAGVTFTF